jgi:hypothetical protein
LILPRRLAQDLSYKRLHLLRLQQECSQGCSRGPAVVNASVVACAAHKGVRPQLLHPLVQLHLAPHLQPVHALDKVLALRALEEAAELYFGTILRRPATQVHIQDDGRAQSFSGDFFNRPPCVLAGLEFFNSRCPRRAHRLTRSLCERLTDEIR